PNVSNWSLRARRGDSTLGYGGDGLGQRRSLDFLQSQVELLTPSCAGLVHGSFRVRGDSTLNKSNDDPSYLRLPIPACASKNSSPMDIGLSPEGLSDPSPKDEE
ncbi:hypothetical protein FOZ63_019541, partial [Perkinsus olseni]